MEALFGLVIWVVIAIAAAIANKKRREQALRESEPSAEPPPVPEKRRGPGGELGDLLRSLQRGLLNQPQVPKPRRKKRQTVEAKPVSEASATPPPVPVVRSTVEKVQRPSAGRYTQSISRGGSAGLRQGIVWAEVLGTPKGLQEPDSTGR